MTDIGLVRTSNQDAVYTSDSPVGALPNLYIVADGMGGQQAGEYASGYAVSRFVGILQGQEPLEKPDILQLLTSAAMEVNQELYQESSREGPHKGTGTTLVAGVIQGNILYVVNVGDSRLYRIGSEIQQITLDHSYAEELFRRGQVNRESEAYWSKKNILTRAIGPWKSVEVDRFSVSLVPGDKVLLCSDGLCGMVTDARMAELICHRFFENQEQLLHCGAELIEEAKRNGGSDNITLALIAPDLS